MALPLHQAALFAFAALMLIAAFEDFRSLMIPNVLTLSLCLLWPLYVLFGLSILEVGSALGCAILVFFCGALCFARGYLGGGDVKLLTAAALWAGPTAIPALLAITGLLGGVLALFLITPIGAPLLGTARSLLGRSDITPLPGPRAMQVPYGIAIAAAALIIVLPPNFS